MIPTWSGALGLVALLLLAVQSAPAVDQVITGRMHHLRSGPQREWAEFPERAEGTELVLAVQAKANQAERTLRSNKGALIYRITDEVSRATGLIEGDVILAINRTPIATASQVAGVLEAMGTRQVFQIWFERHGVINSTELAFR